MKTQRTQAIVLRRTDYGEADRILQLLTPEGRANVMARGVRRQKSKLAGGIELFATCDVVIGQGKGELGVLTSARLVAFYRHILEDYDRMQFAYEVLKQVGRASETLDEPQWYDIVSEVLKGLDDRTIELSLTKTWFYLNFSAMVGYELNTWRDIQGNKLLQETKYRYDSLEKGFTAALNGELTEAHIKLLRLISTKPLTIVAQIGGISEVLGVCLQVSREHAAI